MPPKVESNTSRKRAYHPKSRTGCWSCRSRKVKCDEGKPACQRCKNYGMRCAGYSSVRPIFSAYRSLIEDQENQKIYKAPSIPLMSSILEEQYFNLFRTKTINAILPYFDSNGWEKTWRNVIMDACNTEPALFHSLVALGALEKTCEVIRIDKNPDSASINPHHEFALKEYGKAIKKLRKGAQEGLHDTRIVLLTTMFIICFEQLHGNYESSTAQIQVALAVIAEWKAKYDTAGKHDVGFSSPAPYEIPNSILQAFGRFELQSMLFIDTRPTEVHVQLKKVGEETVKSMPEVFNSMEEARLYLDLIIRRLMHWMAQVGLHEVEELSEKDSAVRDALSLRGKTSTSTTDEREPLSSVPSPEKILDAAEGAELSKSRTYLTKSSDPGFLLPTVPLVRSYTEPTEPQNLLPTVPLPRILPAAPLPRTHHVESTEPRFLLPSNSVWLTPDICSDPLYLDEVYDEQKSYVSELMAWQASAQLLYASSDPSSPDIMGLWLMRLNFLYSFITIQAKLTSSELIYDYYTPEFDEMVFLCKSILSKLNSESAAARSSLHFTLEQGVLTPLYLIMTKCRVSSLRKEALILCSMHKRREGNWGSELTAATGGWVIQLEEERMLEDGTVPEKARISHINLNGHLGNRRAAIRCERWSESEGKVTTYNDILVW